MGNYGKIAVEAIRKIQSGTCLNPVEAWKKSALETFPTKEASRKKGCPKGAFLGLCEAGLITGVEKTEEGIYTKSKANKKYAIQAIEFIKNEPELANSQAGLWQKVMNGEVKQPNSQMDVVISLYENKMLIF